MEPFAEENSSIESVATIVNANKVEKKEGKNVFRYSLKHSKKIKTLPTKKSVSSAVKVKLLLYLTHYFKG